MRHAVVVAPPRFVLPVEGSVFAAPEPVGPLCAALSRGGRRLMLVQTSADLSWDFEQAIAPLGPDDDLVVCIAADTTLRGDGVTLRLGDDPEAVLPLSALSDAVLARGPSGALFVLEARHDGDPGDPLSSVEHVDALLRALDARARGQGALVGVYAESDEPPAPWPFLRHFLSALDEPASRDDRGATLLSLLHEVVRDRVDADVRSFAIVQGAADFPILEAPVVSDVAPRPPSTPSLADAVGEALFEAAPPPPDAPPALDDSAPPAPIDEAAPGDDNAQAPANDQAPVEGAPQTAPADENPQVAADAPTEGPPTTPEGLPGSLPSSSDGIAASPPPPFPDDSWPAIPEPRSTQPSLPAIEPLLDLADEARERGALPEALAGYKAALMIVGPDDSATRATIYAHIGQIKRTQGRPREAELNFEKALSMQPTHQAALDALVELATEANEVRRAVEWRRKRLDAATGPDERVGELLAIADAYAESFQDPRSAARALDEADAIENKSLDSLKKLRAAYEKLQRWRQVARVIAQMADLAADPVEKSRLFFSAADISLGRLRDEEQGLALLDRAFDANPTNDQAFQALAAVRSSREEWALLDATYGRAVDRFAVVGDAERAWDVCRKLAVLRRDKLRDIDGAVEAFLGAIRCKPSDVDSRAMLADAYLAVGDEARAIAEFERISTLAPTRSSTYARLFSLHLRASRTDRAWLAGSVLAELGTADMDQQLVVDQYRLDGPVRPSRSLDDCTWDELLRAPGADEVVAEVLRAISRAAVATRVDELRQGRQLAVPDPARRQSAASTVTAVRSFQWAAQVLGVEPPDLYVMDSVPGGIAAVQAAVPTTALGPDVLRGLTTKDLGFLAARHLTYYRPEHCPLVYYPTLNELSVLFLAAVKIAMPDLPVPSQLRDAVARTRKVLARQIDDDEQRRLGAAVDRLHARDGRADLSAWIRSVELSGQRAGLLLCGDLSVATARLRSEAESRAIAELTFEEKRADLLSFCASPELARARAHLGVDAHKSVSGPPATELQAS